MSERKAHDLKSGETVQVTREELYRIIDEAYKAEGTAHARKSVIYECCDVIQAAAKEA